MIIGASTLRRLASPLVILLVWELSSRTQVLNPLLVPPPTKVFVDIWQLTFSGQILDAVWASLRRVVAGFSIAVVISVFVGMLMASFRIVEDFVDPLVELIRPVSPLALFPLALLWFGIGDASKIFLIALSCSFPIILNTYAGVKGLDVSLIRAARSLGAGQWEVVRRIILPGSLPSVLTGIRIAWGIALIVIIASEMVGAINGLGFMVLDAQQTFKVERVFAGIIIIGLIGFATDRGLRGLRKLLIPWYQEYRE